MSEINKIWNTIFYVTSLTKLCYPLRMENSNIIFFSSFMFYKVSFLNSDINENEKKYNMYNSTGSSKSS